MPHVQTSAAVHWSPRSFFFCRHALYFLNSHKLRAELWFYCSKAKMNDARLCGIYHSKMSSFPKFCAAPKISL